MSSNVYHNASVGAAPNPAVQAPDAIDAAFFEAANTVLGSAAELARSLVGAHQSAAAIVVENDWRSVRKYFSLSEKYAAWKDYAAPATGYGSHGWLLRQTKPVRLTQEELVAHPEWKNFGTENGKHPPMRGWIASPIMDSKGQNWGLIQLSDKYEGDFTAEDEAVFIRFVALVSATLEAHWEVRNLKKAAAGLPLG